MMVPTINLDIPWTTLGALLAILLTIAIGYSITR
jgi:hypothetical protein